MKDISAEEQFLVNVATHEMTVLRDDGVYRHLRFRRPQSNVYWFDLITWSGTLCIDGDMGTFVFRRLEDMFEFFRTDRRYGPGDRKLYVNPSYWAEKIQSADRGGYEKFSEERFREIVKGYFDDWVDAREPSDEDKAELWEAIEEEVLWALDDGEHAAFSAAHEFDNEKHRFRFVDFWDHRFTDYTHQYIWCCYAIAWGVEKYDTHKSATATAEVA